ncbi:beta-1,4-galactosyltransferase 1-like [Rhinatrema bivittatum]|uniref:beta-1,4-galactosyltransferase 1-like n=1 Tax=Rhinatrema bivittatum TaxID=194408 RepID=UPI00112B852B|nr:beta-1,4-galactosyltransferase 1-like [Rhinatrema bivittatum]
MGALPGASLQKVFWLLVIFCVLHLVVAMVYYMASRNLDIFQYFTKNKQSQHDWKNASTTPAAEPHVCPETSPLLVGPMEVEFSKPVDLEETKKDNPAVRDGGLHTPKDCQALQKVAVIIPFRNRYEHLKYWLYYLHPILQRQQLDYGVYVINQDGEETFNRAKLLNVGFAEALKDYDYDCFVFSDVDLIPMDDRNIYKCNSQPRHLSVSVDRLGFRLLYEDLFGGVTALSKDQFQKINGFPNNYWGWGGEDDDISKRIKSKGMSLSRPDAKIGTFHMIHHKSDEKNEPNPQRFNKIAHTEETMNSDGLNSLSYEVVKTEKKPLYTIITVNIGLPKR